MTEIESAGSMSSTGPTKESPNIEPSFPTGVRRRTTAASIGGVSIAGSAPGFYDARIHGSCPRCHHFHSGTATYRISRDPNVFSGVRCEKCSHKWFGIGGSASHLSLASQKTIEPESSYVDFHAALMRTVRTMTIVGSPMLAVVSEDESKELSHNPSQSTHRTTQESGRIEPTVNISYTQIADTITTSNMSIEAATNIHTSPIPECVGKKSRKLSKNLSKKLLPRNVKGKFREGLKAVRRFRIRHRQSPEPTSSRQKGKAVVQATTQPDPKSADDTRIVHPTDTPRKFTSSMEEKSSRTQHSIISKEVIGTDGWALRPEQHSDSLAALHEQLQAELTRVLEKDDVTRTEILDWIRRKLTENKPCSCRTECVCGCRPRHYVLDDSLVDYTVPSDAPWDIMHVGTHFDNVGSSVYNRPLSFTTTLSVPTSQATTVVGHGSMTATSGPLSQLSIPFIRPRSRSPRTGSQPPSRLNQEWFPSPSGSRHSGSDSAFREGSLPSQSIVDADPIPIQERPYTVHFQLPRVRPRSAERGRSPPPAQASLHDNNLTGSPPDSLSSTESSTSMQPQPGNAESQQSSRSTPIMNGYPSSSDDPHNTSPRPSISASRA